MIELPELEYPGNSPWKHQGTAIEKGVRKMIESGGYALLMEMGTGKTFTSITIMRHLFKHEKRLLRTMVFCPPVVRENWRREILQNSKIPANRVHVLDGPGSKRLGYFVQKTIIEPSLPIKAPESHIFITNYESLSMKDLFDKIKKWGPELIIWDESHKLKNHRSKRAKLATKLADLAGYKLLLTGTPILNTPMDIWSQFRVMDGGLTFDANFIAFRSRYFVDKNAGMPKQKYFPNWQPLPGLADQFNELIYQSAFRALKKDCLDLPPMVRKTLEVEMVPEQEKMYEEMEEHFIAYLDQKACVASIALTKALRMQQIVTGFFVDDEGEVTIFEKNPRLQALKEVLEEVAHNHKVIVWASFKENYKMISKVCDDLGLGYRMLTGGMSDKQRNEAIDQFNEDPSARVMISNQQCGGVGVNLTAASYSVYYSKNFSLEADLQSEARNHRGGSEVHESITRIDLICPGTIDQTVTQALHNKESVANAILRIEDEPVSFSNDSSDLHA